MYKLNNILLSTYGILPGRVSGEGIAVKGLFDLPKRIGVTSKKWDESNGVEPYVDADEIFLGGRTLVFQGIMLGSKSTIETNIFNLKTAIDAFNATVPFETPYGNACVIVQKMTPKIYIGGATIIIEFREPSVGANCGVSTEVTNYLSEVYSETAVKNNCADGYDGSTVTFTSPAGQFSSPISVAAANLLAVQWVQDRKQDYANVHGTCTIRPIIYYNEAQTATKYRNNCDPNYSGSLVSLTVPAYTMAHNSLISLADANAKAMAAANALLTQDYANLNGVCEYLVSFIMTDESYTPISYGGSLHTQTFKVGDHMLPGTNYSLMLYGITFTVTSVEGDTAGSIADAFLAQMTAVTDWNVNNQLPVGAGNPSVFIFMPGSGYLSVWLSFSATATAWIGNPPWWNNLQL
jgi:hypothetical protein